MEGFTIEGWDDFVENFSKFVDKWADKKKILLQRMANIYHGEVIPHVPVEYYHFRRGDTSRFCRGGN